MMGGHQGVKVVPGVLLAAVALVACTTGDAHPSDSTPGRQPQWSVTLPSEWGPVWAAQVQGDVVAVQLRDAFAVLDRRTGATRWSQTGVSDTDHVFLLGDVTVLLIPGGSHPRLDVFELGTGRRRYTHQLTGQDGDAVVTRLGPVVADCPPQADECTVARLDLVTGRSAWK